MYTEAINHDPAITFFQTGRRSPGRPSMGAWVSYGLGSENEDLPAFVVLISQGRKRRSAALRAAVGQRLPADAVSGRAVPRGRRSGAVSRQSRRRARASAAGRCSTRLRELQRACSCDELGDPEIDDAHRAVRDGVSHADERAGADRLSKRDRRARSSCTAPTRGSRARSPRTACWRGGWRSAACGSSSSITAAGTSTATCRASIAGSARDTDQPRAALVTDLKQRGLLDDTLVVWGGEFGRTIYSQGKLTADNYGRDHHPRCFTIWMAGGGVKAGLVYGATDDFGYNVTENGCTSTISTRRCCNCSASITSG